MTEKISRFIFTTKERLRIFEDPHILQIAAIVALVASIPVIVLMVSQIQNFKSKAYETGIDCRLSDNQFIKIKSLGPECRVKSKVLLLELTSPFDSINARSSFGIPFVKEATAQSPTKINSSTWISKNPSHSNYIANLSDYHGMVLVNISNPPKNIKIIHSFGGSDQSELRVLNTTNLAGSTNVVVDPLRMDGQTAYFGFLKICDGLACEAFSSEPNLSIGAFVDEIIIDSKNQMTLKGRGFGKSGIVQYSSGGIDIKELPLAKTPNAYTDTQITIDLAKASKSGYVRVCRKAENSAADDPVCGPLVGFSDKSNSTSPPVLSNRLNIKEYCLETLTANSENRKEEKVRTMHLKNQMFKTCYKWASSKDTTEVPFEIENLEYDRVVWVLFKAIDGRTEYYYTNVPVGR